MGTMKIEGPLLEEWRAERVKLTISFNGWGALGQSIFFVGSKVMRAFTER